MLRAPKASWDLEHQVSCMRPSCNYSYCTISFDSPVMHHRGGQKIRFDLVFHTRFQIGVHRFSKFPNPQWIDRNGTIFIYCSYNNALLCLQYIYVSIWPYGLCCCSCEFLANSPWWALGNYRRACFVIEGMVMTQQVYSNKCVMLHTTYILKWDESDIFTSRYIDQGYLFSRFREGM